MIPSMVQAFAGMQQATSSVRAAATEIAGAGLPGVERAQGLVTPLVEKSIQVRQFETSTAVLKASDEMLGSLLDVKA